VPEGAHRPSAIAAPLEHYLPILFCKTGCAQFSGLFWVFDGNSGWGEFFRNLLCQEVYQFFAAIFLQQIFSEKISCGVPCGGLD
jgi:hypothetical protein